MHCPCHVSTTWIIIFQFSSVNSVASRLFANMNRMHGLLSISASPSSLSSHPSGQVMPSKLSHHCNFLLNDHKYFCFSIICNSKWVDGLNSHQQDTGASSWKADGQGGFLAAWKPEISSCAKQRELNSHEMAQNWGINLYPVSLGWSSG